MRDFYRISTLGIIALVALRIGIGWHFFKEGSDKIKTGTFSSEGFFKSSEGRLSGLFHSLVWDADGSLRLDQEKLIPHYEQSIADAKKRFTLSQQQTEQLDKAQTQFVDNLNEVFAQYSSEIDKFQKSSPRVEKMEESPVWQQISTLRGHRQKIEKERLAEVWPAVESINALTKRFEQQVNSVLSSQQPDSPAQFRLNRPGEGILSAQTIDKILPVFDLTIGILLIIGLLVPLASWLGALFLLGVVLSQFPGDPGTQPTYFQSVEMLSLILLGSVGAGRFAGLDFFIWSMKQNRKAARLESGTTQK